jgi:hypothetical protein
MKIRIGYELIYDFPLRAISDDSTATDVCRVQAPKQLTSNSLYLEEEIMDKDRVVGSEKQVKGAVNAAA